MDERSTIGPLTWAMALMLIVFTIYILLPGPLLWLVRYDYISAATYTAVEFLFAPLELVLDRSPFLERLYGQYLQFGIPELGAFL